VIAGRTVPDPPVCSVAEDELPNELRSIVGEPDVLRSMVYLRRAQDWDRYDDCDDGVYRAHHTPSPRHQLLKTDLCMVLDPLARARGLWAIWGVNVGTDPDHYRLADVAVLDRNPREDDFLWCDHGAVLVAEVVEGDERPLEKVPRFRAQGVRELLVVEREVLQCQLWDLTVEPGDFAAVRSERSAVLDLDVTWLEQQLQEQQQR
jgi:hypothetical protein